MLQRVLILGGAGFIGSHLAERFSRGGWRVTVIDGLLPRTGGRAENLNHIEPPVELLPQPVEAVADLPALVEKADLIIDAMAWTAHLLALRDPRYDLQLNLASHLALMETMRTSSARRVIYLGSRGQYGNPPDNPIVETTAMEPRDVQGVHKLAAESYFRVLAPLYRFDAISLRIPNCFGERQPTHGEDIGLVGGFIREAILGKSFDVYGRDRCRCILYVGDLAEIVYRVAGTPFSGFIPLNTGGHQVSIAELAETIVRLAGCGSCTVKSISDEIKAIDSGNAYFSAARLEALIGGLPSTSLEHALTRTITWFKNHL